MLVVVAFVSGDRSGMMMFMAVMMTVVMMVVLVLENVTVRCGGAGVVMLLFLYS